MSPRTTGGLGLVRSAFAGKPTWALVGSGALAHARADHVHTAELEATAVDRQELGACVEDAMDALDNYGASLASTPGGAGWLHVQHVPVRRFVAEIVRKLLVLSVWAPFASAQGPLVLAPYEGLVGLRSSSSREYLAYTVTLMARPLVPATSLRTAELHSGVLEFLLQPLCLPAGCPDEFGAASGQVT
ncbi:hypothetical protein [Streptomyces sp. NPDC056188]|uniref:hypothetical protein n=1 Tax=Streptomyces sp. NPDC056188 TaxID=3345740 RepID=UPI0035DE72FA